MGKRGEEASSSEFLRKILKSLKISKGILAFMLFYTVIIMVIAYILSPYFVEPLNWSKPVAVEMKIATSYFWVSQVLPGSSEEFYIIGYSKPHMFQEVPHPGTLAWFKLSINGEIVSRTVIEERSRSSGNCNILYSSAAISKNDNTYIAYQEEDGIWKLIAIDNDGKILMCKSLYSGVGIVKVDTSGDIHLRAGENYTKINSDGNIIVNHTSLKNVTISDKFPIVRGEKGDLIYLGYDGLIDDKGVVHILSRKITFSGPTTYVNMFYSRYSINGTLLFSTDRYLALEMCSYWIDDNGNAHIAFVHKGSNDILYEKIDSNGKWIVEKEKVLTSTRVSIGSIDVFTSKNFENVYILYDEGLHCFGPDNPFLLKRVSFSEKMLTVIGYIGVFCVLVLVVFLTIRLSLLSIFSKAFFVVVEHAIFINFLLPLLFGFSQPFVFPSICVCGIALISIVIIAIIYVISAAKSSCENNET